MTSLDPDESFRKLAQELAAVRARKRTEDFGTIAELQAKLKGMERERAARSGEEYATPIDWPYPWRQGQSRPHLIATVNSCFLLYSADLEPTSEPVQVESVAVAHFNKCYAARFGGPNDEVLQAHPLYSRGLEHYSAHAILNSKWLAEVERINSIHAAYDPSYWHQWQHLFLTFKDGIFECLATSPSFSLRAGGMEDVIAEVFGKV